MGACGGGELLAAHVCGTPLPAYAAAFHPARFDDPGSLDAFAGGADGQLRTRGAEAGTRGTA